MSRPRATVGCNAFATVVGVSDFTHKQRLDGDLVTLVPASREHVDQLYPLLDDHEVSVLTGSVHTSEPGQPLPWSRDEIADIYQAWSQADDRLVWVIVDNSTGRIVGESVLHELDDENNSCGFRIWISGATGRGLGTEATRLTMAHAFEVQGLHRVELEVYAFNPRARHVYEKCGFVHEGTRRGALRFDERWIDCDVMALLDSDWHAASMR